MRAVLRGRRVVDRQAVPDRVDVAVVVRRVETVHSHRRPFAPNPVGGADAVHVVDNRAAAQRRPGEDRDGAVLARGQSAAEVELQHPGQLELLEVGLVAVLPLLEHQRLAPGALQIGRDHGAARARADHAHIGLELRGRTRDGLDLDRLGRLLRSRRR